MIPQPTESIAPVVRSSEPSDGSPYDRFAWVYDRNFGQFAARVFPPLQRLALRHVPVGGRVLDVCCGTGQLARTLTDHGYQVTGVDGSEGMLRIARRNAPSARFLRHDVRSMRMDEEFDAAISTFDSINHLLEVSDLVATFRGVHRVLRHGAPFVFDMNMDEGYRCRWWGTWQEAVPNARCRVEAVYTPESRLARNIVTWAGPEDGDPITFSERCYPEETVREALEAAGFRGIEVHDGHRDLGLFGEIGRSFFVGWKSEGRRAGAEARQPATVVSNANDGDCDGESRRESRRYRELSDCVAAGLWPETSLVREVGWNSHRLTALEEVLCRLPPAVYARLRATVGRFDWFIPGEWVLGQVHPFRSTHREPGAKPEVPTQARVVYLSPVLERQDSCLVAHVVVHELAHVILEHRLSGLDAEAYRRQEREARTAAVDWGFGAEVAAAEARLPAVAAAVLFGDPPAAACHAGEQLRSP
ncbi:MAG: methyltransferase domain-containing protein [Limisphaerales bacterium]